MSARPAMWPLLIAFPATLFISSSALASSLSPGPWLPNPGEYYTEFRAGSFSADTYQDPTGARQSLAPDSVVAQRSLLSYVELGWKKKLSFVLGVPALSVTKRSHSVALTNNDTGLSDLLLGLRFKIMEGPPAMAVEASWEAPMGYNAKLSDGLGDGYQAVAGTLAAGAALGSRIFVQGSGGYRYRFFDDPLKSEEPAAKPAILLRRQRQILASADAGMWIGSSLLVAGRYQGVVTVAHGGRSPEVNVHRAGPAAIYRVDDHLDVFAGSMHTASAKNALHTDEFYVGVAYKQTRLNRLQGFLGGKREP